MQVSTLKNEENSTYMGGAGTTWPWSVNGKVQNETDQNDKNNNLPIGSSMTRAGFVRTRILIGTTQTI